MTGGEESGERTSAGSEGERTTRKKATGRSTAATRKKPSRLLSQTKRETRDGGVVNTRDGGVVNSRPQTRAPQGKQRLPQVFTYSSRMSTAHTLLF